MAAQKKQSSSMLFFFMLMLAMLVLFDEGLRGTLADAVGAVFFPLHLVESGDGFCLFNERLGILSDVVLALLLLIL